MRKLTVVSMLVAAGLLLSITFANGQGNLARKNMEVREGHMSLIDIFREVQMQAGFMFVFQPTLVDQFTHLAVPGGIHSVQEFLDIVLRDTPVGFEENGRNIIIFRRPITFNIRGRVKDAETGEGLPGVTIYIKDSNKGTHSESDGSYTITGIKDDILVFSYVGRITKQVTINEHTPKVIELHSMTLPEVMIHTGYYDVAEPERIGSISTFSRKQLERSPVLTPLQSIQGRMAGVFVEQLSGLPASGYKIRIRGENSLRNNGNEPLYIVDGIPFPAASMVSQKEGYAWPLANAISLIPLSSIDQIDVLKDADATAIYGSRGANGVVLLTTRRPNKEGAGAEINVSTGISQVGHHMNLLNTTQWLQMRNWAHDNEGVPRTPYNAPDLIYWDSQRNVDWQKELIGGVSPVTNAVVNLYGGEGRTLFYFNTNYYKEGTVFPRRFDYSRGSTWFTMQHQSKDDRLEGQIRFSYTADNNHLPTFDITSQAFTLAPNAPKLYSTDGQLNWEHHDGLDTWYNPLAYLERTSRTQTSNLIGHAQLSYKILPHLVLKTSLSQTLLIRKEEKIEPLSYYAPTVRSLPETSGQHSIATHTVKLLMAEPILEYNHHIRAGKFNFLIGSTLQRMLQNGQATTGWGYKSDALIGDISAAPFIDASKPINNDYRYAAAFSRMNYNWKGKYIINLTARRDGSSRFGAGQNFSNFGSVGGAWVFSKEPFADKVLWISFGKIRATYGITGNDQIDDYSTQQEYAQIPSYGGTGVSTNQPANSLYTWERTSKAEVGLDIGFLRNRIQLDLAYYRNRSSNQLTNQRVPTTSGFQYIQMNVPLMIQNLGFEMVVNATLFDGQYASWVSNLNFTLPYNKLLRYDKLSSSADSARYKVGESLNSRLVYQTKVDPATGLYVFTDRNGNGQHDAGDRYSIVEGARYYGGWDNTLRVHHFQLDISLQLVKQVGVAYAANAGPPGSRHNNYSVAVLDRWQKEGDITKVPRYTVSNGVDNYLYGQWYGDVKYTDASYVRVKNVSLAYHFPSALAKRLALQTMKAYMQAQNLFTITPYDGVDPETLLYTNLPPLRTVIIGLQVTL